MPLHVEELVTEAVMDDAETAGGPRGREGAMAMWEQVAMLRRLQARALLDDARVAAVGMED